MNVYCYHGRDSRGQKLFGGTLHAETLQQAAERAVAGYKVRLRSGVGAYFVDKEGREVSLYLSIHPEYTERGAKEIAAARAERAEADRKQAEEQERLGQELNDEISSLGGTAEVLKALRSLKGSEPKT